MSADVTFFEISPYFSSNTASKVFIPTTLLVPTLPSPLISPTPLHVYSHRPHPPTNTIDAPLLNTGTTLAFGDSYPLSSSPIPVSPSTDDSTPTIAIWKGIRSSQNPHPIYNFVSYHRLSRSYYAFVTTLSNVSVPKAVREALEHPWWCNVMVEEMTTLHNNGT